MITPVNVKPEKVLPTAEKVVKKIASKSLGENVKTAQTCTQPPLTGLGTDLVKKKEKYVKPECTVYETEPQKPLAYSGEDNNPKHPNKDNTDPDEELGFLGSHILNRA